jgi:hypothetical protein
MPQNRASSHGTGRSEFGRAVLGAAAATLVVCAFSSSARAGDDDNGQSYTDKFLTTLGLQNPGSVENSINYSERSPLVVPPTRNLPPPVAAGPPPVPNWPKDPDFTRSAATAAASAIGPHPDWASESDRALRPDELNVGRKVTAPDQRPGTPDPSSPTPTAKKGLFSFDWAKKEQYATFTGEPARGSLTDPPPGYLTPSPDQPYGVGPEKAHYHVPTPSEHGEPTR